MIPVGHRALVAVERADGRYDCYYSHDGAYEWRLLDALTGTDDPIDPHAVDGLDPAPLATDESLGTVVETRLDFCTYEACYRVDRDGTVAPWLVCWFGFPTVETGQSGAGVLLGVDPDDARADGGYARGWYEGTKGVLTADVAAGRLSAAEARRRLCSRVETWACDRAVVFGPAVEPSADGDDDRENCECGVDGA